VSADGDRSDEGFFEVDSFRIANGSLLGAARTRSQSPDEEPCTIPLNVREKTLARSPRVSGRFQLLAGKE